MKKEIEKNPNKKHMSIFQDVNGLKSYFDFTFSFIFLFLYYVNPVF